MSISAASILKDGVIAVTGGTAKSFSSLGNTLHENRVVFDGTGILSRSSADFVSKSPTYSSSSPSNYTQARNTVTFRFPKTLASGDVVYNTARIQIATDVETTSAEIDTLRGIVAQVLSDTDFDGYWRNQEMG